MGINREFFLERSIAGLIAGIGYQLFHPLDLIKIRMQNNDASEFRNIPKYKGYLHLIKNIYRTEGARAFYKGILFSFIPNFFIGLYFGTEALLRNYFNSRGKELQAKYLTPMLLSFFFSFIATPMSIVKTWTVMDVNAFNERRRVRHIVKEIHRTLGTKGFLRGYWLVFSSAFQGILTLSLYSIFKQLDSSWGNGTTSTFLTGFSARWILNSFFYPFNLLKSRMMQNQVFKGLDKLKFEGYRECLRETYQKEGIRGFYKGFIAFNLRSAGSSGVMFWIYESSFTYLKQFRIQKELENIK